jgi:hypothetical protein
MGLLQLSENWAKIDFIDLAGEVLLDMSDFIAELNRNQMQKKGIRGDGTEITPLYTELTDFLKTRKGQRTDHVTLKDTGSFHNSITADIYGNDLILDATDSKTSDLLDKYGDEVLGLTNESIKLLRAKFMPLYIQAIKNKL